MLKNCLNQLLNVTPVTKFSEFFVWSNMEYKEGFCTLLAGGNDDSNCLGQLAKVFMF